jgi:hypothetical protein
MKRASSTLLLRTVFAITLCVPAHALGEQPGTGRIEQAAFRQAAPKTSAERVRFQRRAAQVGDRVEQEVNLQMRMTTSIRQANELAGQHRNTVTSNLRRTVTTLEVADGRTSAVTVEYQVAAKGVIESHDTKPRDLQASNNTDDLQKQPVEGKTYVIRREPGQDGALVITDINGNRPPAEEYEIVQQQMQMVGRANPLAEFLAGREITIGERIELPKEVAGQLFNLGDGFGKVTRFALTLQSIESQGGTACAVFKADVEAASSTSTQMRLQVDGPLFVEVATCRAQKVSLIGPIGMSQTRGTYSTAYQVIGTGRLQMSIASNYRDAAQ